MTTKQHGGQRAGAGRKPKSPEQLYARIQITLPPEQLAWLRRHPAKVSQQRRSRSAV